MDSTIDWKESVNLRLEHLKKLPNLYNIEKLKKTRIEPWRFERGLSHSRRKERMWG